MPPRLVTIAILLFWLGTMGWVFYREVSPWFGTGAPPLFHIGLTEEVIRSQTIKWDVFNEKGKKIGRATSEIKKRFDQPFDLKNEVYFDNLTIPSELGDFKLSRISDLYRVDRKGELVEFNATMEVKINGVPTEAIISGMVEDNQFVPKLAVQTQGFAKPITLDLPAVDVSNSGKIINILHPQNKIVGLFRGRSWKVSAFNPLSASVSVFSKSVQMPSLKAEVFADQLEWENEKFPCWRVDVTEPTEKVRRARIWVRRSDGLVLQHEASYQDQDMILRRLK